MGGFRSGAQRVVEGQKEQGERRIAVVNCRVIVPTSMLPQIARQLTCDPRVMEMIDLATDLDSAAARH